MREQLVFKRKVHRERNTRDKTKLLQSELYVTLQNTYVRVRTQRARCIASSIARKRLWNVLGALIMNDELSPFSTGSFALYAPPYARLRVREPWPGVPRMERSYVGSRSGIIRATLLLADGNSLANSFASTPTVMPFFTKTRRAGPRNASSRTGDIFISVGGRKRAFKLIKINGVKISDCLKYQWLFPRWLNFYVK